MEFIGFLHIQMSSWRRIKAKTLRWDPCDRVLGRFDMDTEEARAAWVQTTDTVNTLEWRKMIRPRRSAFHDLYQIFPFNYRNGAQMML